MYILGANMDIWC